MTSKCAEIKADVSKHRECAAKAVTRISLGEQSFNIFMALVTDQCLDLTPDVGNVCSVLLRKIQLLKFRIERNEGSTNPVVKSCNIGRQTLSPSNE